MKVVILAGGLGTRLSEETDIKPKPMVEIGGKPILWHIMKLYSKYHCNDFIILLGYKGYYIKEYFANYFLHQSDIVIDLKSNSMEILNNSSEPWKVTLVDTGINTMTGGRLNRARSVIGNNDFMLTYGDGVSNVNIKLLEQFHSTHEGYLTMTSYQPQGRFGALNLNNENKVQSFQEKPKGDGGWVNAGFFVCSPQIFDYIENNDDCVFEEGPLMKLAEDSKLYTYKHVGFWKPMDSLKDKNDLNELWSGGEAPWKVW